VEAERDPPSSRICPLQIKIPQCTNVMRYVPFEKSLGRQPIKDGIAGHTVDRHVFRPEAANTAIKMGGQEVGLFRDRVEVTSKMDFDDLSDDELLRRLRDETDALIRERAERARANAKDELARKIASGRGAVIAVRAKANQK
jgi:hypothetical protein